MHRAAEPVHVTLRSRLATLRSPFVYPTVRLALLRAASRDVERFRIVQFSVQRDHIHLIVEARDHRALSWGMRGVAIRVARYVNDLLSRRGSLWRERWHGRALRSPLEVRNALLYVLANFRKHSRRAVRAGIDPYSSSAFFDGWRGWHPDTAAPPPFAESKRWRDAAPDAENEPNGGLPDGGKARAFTARTWLATVGWRKHGLLGLSETPNPANPSSNARRRTTRAQGASLNAKGK